MFDDDEGAQGVGEEEMDEIKRAYGSFVVGGRWSNAIGTEWREQGGEFAMHPTIPVTWLTRLP